MKMSGNIFFRIEGGKIEEVWVFFENQKEDYIFWKIEYF